MKEKEMSSGRGVGSGHCLSPILFSIFIEKLTWETLEKARGIVMGEERIKPIKYADDHAVLVESEEKPKCTIQSIVEVGKQLRMKINIGKTKVI